MSPRWSIDLIKDDTYRAKFVGVVDAISAWMENEGGIAGRHVLDFGCGEGTVALGMALRCNPRRLVATEIQATELARTAPLAREQLGLVEMPTNLELLKVDPESSLADIGQFDLVYSWSVFEHIHQDLIVDCLAKIYSVLRPGGHMFLQTTPLYYSAFGSHFEPWIPIPWAHLTMQHDRFYTELRKNTNDEALYRSLIDTYETLNRATDPQLLVAAREVGFEIIREHRTYDEQPIPEPLKCVYQESVLRTNQLVFLARCPA